MLIGKRGKRGRESLPPFSRTPTLFFAGLFGTAFFGRFLGRLRVFLWLGFRFLSHFHSPIRARQTALAHLRVCEQCGHYAMKIYSDSSGICERIVRIEACASGRSCRCPVFAPALFLHSWAEAGAGSPCTGGGGAHHVRRRSFGRQCRDGGLRCWIGQDFCRRPAPAIPAQDPLSIS